MHQLTAQDWSWIVGFLLVAFGLALYHSRKSSQSIEDYFVAGKNTPWWILGTSIVATTFAADTPLVVCGLVITQGISGNWYWWAVVPSGMLGVFFFAKLWRRSGCLTQAEFAIIRYGPERAKVLRLFYVFYHGVLRNAVTLGFVNLAMAKIITLCTPFGQWEALSFCFVLTVVYTILGGINGVMWTDFFQFFLALATSVAIAYYAVQFIGQPFDGFDWRSLTDKDGLGAVRGIVQEGWATGKFSTANGAYFAQPGSMASWGVLIYVTIFWIACTSTDCSGYAVQRMLCARNERHAAWGYLWYNFAHYVLRSWPWIIVGVAAVLLYSEIPLGDIDSDSPTYYEAPEDAYVRVILHTTPTWLLGPALVSLLAAYMSTVDTHLNWGASYLINDFYVPYVKPGQSPKHYVRASHIATAFIAIAGVATTALMSSIVQGWGLLFGLLSGMGIVGILRWMWWRVNAWTELGCMIAAGLATGIMHFAMPQVEVPFNFLVIVPAALIGAAIGTFGFSPEPRNVLVTFAQLVRPPGPGWRRVFDAPRRFPVIVEGDKNHPSPERQRRVDEQIGYRAEGLLRPTICWVMGTAAIYCAMFGVGDLLLKSKLRGTGLCAAAVVLAVLVGLIYRSDESEC